MDKNNSVVTTREVQGVTVHTISPDADDAAKLATGRGVRDGDVIVTADVVAIRIGSMACAIHPCKVSGFAELDLAAGDTWRSALGGRYADAYDVAADLHAANRIGSHLRAVPTEGASAATTTRQRGRPGYGGDRRRAALVALVDTEQAEAAPVAQPRPMRRRRPAPASSAATVAQVAPVAPIPFRSPERWT